MERTPELKKFIEDRQALFWYAPPPKSETVSDELLVETILNYGQMEDIRAMFRITGVGKVASVFKGMSGRKKLNFYPEIYHYFHLFFEKYAP
jgi:hypothetical protein